MEALAQAAVHSGWMTQFLLEAEKAAGDGTPADSKPVVQLLDEIYEDSKLSRAARWDDENKIRDGVIKRAGTELIDCVSQYKVHPKDLEEKVAEMINAAGMYHLNVLNDCTDASSLLHWRCTTEDQADQV